MKKKMLRALTVLFGLSLVMSGCAKRAEPVGTTAESGGAVSTVGPDSGTKLTFWTFADIHARFYAEMLEQWNREHPDKQLQITFTVYPYTDMHNKMTMAIQTGQGAPDLCDIEISLYPNYLKGNVALFEMNRYVNPYLSEVVRARLDVYGKDGKYYGIPTHVGATVMYYNTRLLESAGIDYKTIRTWDDFAAAGRKLRDATGGKAMMTAVDTGGTDWMWLAMAEHGEDYTDVNGRAVIKQPSIVKMLTLQKQWLDEGIAMISPGDHLDNENGYQAVGSDMIAAFPKAMWYMSRFLDHFPEDKGVWAIAPCPVFTPGQPRSVGIGGTGTVVSLQSKAPDLAAEYLCWTKLSYTGNVKIWEVLGFDTVNTSIWSDPKITTDTSNKYIAYFKSNPFDTLNAIKNEIGIIKVGEINPAINEQFNTNILVGVLQDGEDIRMALDNAQSEIDLEQ